jgi:predicted acylesterase/phospholipase RssA
LRQADRVLLVVSTDRPFTRPPWLPEDRENWHQAFDLVLLHDGCQSVSKIGQNWHERPPLDLICHIRRGNIDDLVRLARLSTGQAVGLVLSSGGARGFAHLGIVRALREADIPIDLIGGCSMGAIVGGAVALEWDDGEMRERLHQAFVESKPINDCTLPFVALTKGRKADQRLEQHFGSTRIEDLWRPFFCVSTNLTAGTLALHRSGTLATALRASISIPGLLPPVMIAGDTHVDGGIMNYLPVDVMSQKRGPVVGVDVSSVPVSKPVGDGGSMRSICQFLRPGRKTPPIVDILVRAATVNGDSRAARLAHNTGMAQAHDFKRALTRLIEPTGGPGVELATLEDAARFVRLLLSWCQARPHWDFAAELLLKAAETGKRRDVEAATAQIERALPGSSPLQHVEHKLSHTTTSFRQCGRASACLASGRYGPSWWPTWPYPVYSRRRECQARL